MFKPQQYFDQFEDFLFSTLNCVLELTEITVNLFYRFCIMLCG